MRLEQQLLYEPRSFEPRQSREKVYTIVDLEYLSASVLYSGDSGSGPLTIRDFPASGFQLHIHEGAGGSANIKPYGSKKGIPISSYDAAMADLLADKLDIAKYLRKDKS